MSQYVVTALNPFDIPAEALKDVHEIAA